MAEKLQTPGLSSSETVEDMKKNYKKIYDELFSIINSINID